MSRTKNPEATIEKILTISEKLFQKKGYEKTTIHDIIRELEMSKGVIYYHFTSKEEILEAVIQKQFKASHDDLVAVISQIEAENAKEKLIKLMNKIQEKASKNSITAVQEVMINQAKNPQFVISGMQISVQQEAPLFAEIIKEGIKDGSLETDYPNECAEIFLLLINLWCSPFMFQASIEEVERRLLFLRHNMKLLGVDIISDQLIAELIGFYQEIYKENGH